MYYNSTWNQGLLLFFQCKFFISKCHGIVTKLNKIQATYNELELLLAFGIQMIKLSMLNTKLDLIYGNLANGATLILLTFLYK